MNIAKLIDDSAIYFDHNATTPMFNEVKEAMLELLSLPLNPSSIHLFGRMAKQYMERARNIIRAFLHVGSDYNIIFTASGTESNNLALRGIPGIPIITSEIEHPAVLSVVGRGDIPVNKHGIVNLNIIQDYLAYYKGNILISVIFANNETGVIQPIDEISKLISRYGGIFHVDAVQAAGKIPIDISALNVDMMTISAHKFGGPPGAAALIAKKKLDLKPIITGGGQEYRIRSGTQNIAAIHGFGVACAQISEHQVEYNNVSELRDYIENQIKEICPDTILFSKEVDRLPNTSSISMPKVKAEAQVIYFDINGIAVSAGSACSSGTTHLPHVQMAMGYPQEIASTALRISLGRGNTIREAEKFIKLWQALYIQSKEH